jgi:hypothetical protein
MEKYALFPRSCETVKIACCTGRFQRRDTLKTADIRARQKIFKTLGGRMAIGKYPPLTAADSTSGWLEVRLESVLNVSERT